MNSILYLPIETKSRELEGQLLIAAEAIKNKYSVVIGHKTFCLKYAEKWKEGIYLYKSCNPKMFPTKNSSFIFGSLDAEGLYQKSDDDLINRNLCNDKLDFVFTWGSKQFDVLNNKYKSFNKKPYKIINSGNPRVDLIFQKKGKVTKTSNNNFTVLFATNFVDENPSPHYKELFSKIKDMEKNQNKKTQTSQYLNAIKELSNYSDRIKVIIRPHPSENIKYWRSNTKNFKKIIVDRKRSLIEQIQSSDLVIHSGSTVGIEAHLLGKSVINFLPEAKHKKELGYLLPNSIGQKVKKTDELLKLVYEIFNGSNLNANQNYLFLSKYISNINRKQTSAQIIIDAFEKKIHKNGKPSTTLKNKTRDIKIRLLSLKFYTHKLLSKFILDLKLKSYNLNIESLYLNLKQGYISKKEILLFMKNNFDKETNSRVKLKKMAYNTFLITLKGD